MRKVILCEGLANGEPGPVGLWLASYEPATGLSGWTSNKQMAIVFKDAFDALALWKSVHTEKPVRPDGKPNRPLTAFTVTIEDA